MAWRDHGWKTRRIYLGTNKEVFDAEFYPIREALEIPVRGGGTVPPWTVVHECVDFQAVIKQLQNNEPGQGQWLARMIIEQKVNWQSKK